MTKIESLRQALHSLRDAVDHGAVKWSLIQAVREFPKTPESLDLYRLGIELLNRIQDPAEKRTALLDFVREIPTTEAYLNLYESVMEDAISAADALEEQHHRITELMRLAAVMPVTGQFLAHRLRAWRLALSLPDKPRFNQVPLDRVAKELPKSLDATFYRRYTLLGIAKEVPKEGPFRELYREAMKLAIHAAAVIEEPYYKRYALMFIANELPKEDEYRDIYIEAITDAYRAADETKDPFAREHALIEVLQEIPKTPDFFPLLQELFEKALSFFTVRRWMDDIEVFDVVDYILSAEELGINETKKRRYSREKYAGILSRELEKFGTEINDTRFIETLRPYAHVWVKPKGLRESVKKVVERLETLTSTYHGREIERPVFVKEAHPQGRGSRLVHKKEAAAGECVSIDLGATNTVIMRKKGGDQPEFVELAPISRQYGSAHIIPTVLSSETNTIGAEVTEENPVVNIKQMLLEGSPKGREQMERFIKILYQHLKKALNVNTGWFSLSSKSISDVLYVTIPVGYTDYRNAMKEILDRTVKGLKTEFIEEPLAAAVGYQVAEDRDKLIMVVDFGGSTLNTMILRLNLNEVHIVAKPDRAQILGGYDIDVWLAEHLAGRLNMPADKIPHRLIASAEEVKIELSRKKEASFEWEGRQAATVTREEFEKILDAHEFYRFVDRAVSFVLRRAEKVGLKKDKIEAVLLTGGSSQIPSFKDKIGHIFPNLRHQNRIYDHSPFSAVGLGAAMYGTRDVSDRHLGVAYAVRYATKDKDMTHSYAIVLEKGELLPLEKTFKVRPCGKLGAQSEIYLELFEVPDSLIARRWVTESGIEYLKQELKNVTGITLNGLKTVSLPFKAPLNGEVEMTLCIDESGELSITYGPENISTSTEIRLQ